MNKLKTLVNMSSSDHLSFFSPFTNNIPEISHCSPLFLNPVEKIENVPDLLSMEMEGYINGGPQICLNAEKLWTVPKTNSSFQNNFHENGGYIRDLQSHVTRERMMMMIEEGNLKVERCNEEERKKKIQRYKEKKMKRNFNKTIKYECRKTLADSRPRIRGRFIRNDETANIISNCAPLICNRINEEDDCFKIDGIFVNGLGGELGPSRFEYYTGNEETYWMYDV